MAEMIIHLLPFDIITDIFSRLPVDSILECKCVCKTWRSLIDELLKDPSFVDTHTHRLLSSPSPAASSYSTSTFLGRENFFNLCRDDHNDNDWSIIGSCNGLVCLVTKSKSLQNHNVYICNPLTREYVNLPCREKQCWQWMSPKVVATGFGYHPCTKEYKFVRITYLSGRLMYVSSYTLGSGRWSTKAVEFSYHRPRFCSKRTEPAAGLFFNGALCWSVSPRYGNIISFDLETEEFRLVLSPPQSRESIDELGVLGGCFCVIRTKDRDGSKDIWVMNMENYTWTKKFRIKPAMEYQIGRVITSFVLDENILLSYGYMKFDSCDPNTRSLDHLIDKYTIDFQMVDYRFEILPYMSSFEMIPYMMSLVSLKALGESSHFVTRRERKRKRHHRKRKRDQDE